MDIPDVDVSKHTDYPPKFSIFVRPLASRKSTDSGTPQLVVEGVDVEECSFEIITPSKGTDNYVANQTIHNPLGSNHEWSASLSPVPRQMPFEPHNSQFTVSDINQFTIDALYIA